MERPPLECTSGPLLEPGCPKLGRTCPFASFNSSSRLHSARRITSRSSPSVWSVHTPYRGVMWGWGCRCTRLYMSSSRAVASLSALPVEVRLTAKSTPRMSTRSTMPKGTKLQRLFSSFGHRRVGAPTLAPAPGPATAWLPHACPACNVACRLRRCVGGVVARHTALDPARWVVWEALGGPTGGHCSPRARTELPGWGEWRGVMMCVCMMYVCTRAGTCVCLCVCVCLWCPLRCAAGALEGRPQGGVRGGT
jgi:hypothetical protein